MNRQIAIAIWGTFAIAAPARAAVEYTVTDLNVAGGLVQAGVDYIPYSINNSGEAGSCPRGLSRPNPSCTRTG